MKALTICQPYAHLIITGEKRVENRTWPTNFRGPMLIHAGKSRDWLDLNHDESLDLSCEIPLSEMAFGAVVGVATMTDCVTLDNVRRFASTGHGIRTGLRWMTRHEHTEGPWCWVLDNVRRFPEPVTYRGAQGLFEIDDLMVEEQVRSAYPVATLPKGGE